MAYGKGPYRSQMRFYPEHPEVLTWVKWTLCQPGAEVLPIPHSFETSFLRCEGQYDLPDIGEVKSSVRRAKRPFVSPYPGKRYAGPARYFEFGAPCRLEAVLPGTRTVLVRRVASNAIRSTAGLAPEACSAR